MKKLALSFIVIALSAGAFAEPTNIHNNTVKTIIKHESVTSVKVYKNVEIILTSSDLNEIQIVGEKPDVENTVVKIINGELTITGLPAAITDDKLLVYVPAKFLASIYIHVSSTVTSTDLLNNHILDVTINGDGKSSIKSAGLMSVNTVGDFPWKRH